ncbi:Ig-like domain-containing protein [Maribellus sediminis]|uniref:Ig-like domain-containing protein n=1 Tax=Maribellus sediminis TaxID=2696285 RepID=UPI00142FE754|nr:Ig-like domain-containing protein [Maribellus sediminis]
MKKNKFSYMQSNASLKTFCFLFLGLFFQTYISAQTNPVEFIATVNKTIPEGSYIVNMGVEPQTYENGLKPYGMVYTLIKIHQVAVEWVINPDKKKDGVDFNYKGTNYRGGTFIVTAPFLTDDVKAEIALWEAKGVVGVYTDEEFEAPVFIQLAFFPTWTLDLQSGNIVEAYFELAEIPEIAYTFSYPTDLNSCQDIFILPHADPSWDNHQRLATWNAPVSEGGNGGWIWAGCHGVSAIESTSNTDDYDNPDPATQMNFLTTNGLVLWGDHDNGSIPYDHFFPTSPIMQFIGPIDGSSEGGSESIYMPKIDGGWNSGVKVLVSDPDHSDLGTLTNGPVAKMAVGRAFNDINRGLVMYEAGHTLTGGSEAQNTASIRAFFNFCFLAPSERAPVINGITVENIVMEGGLSYNVSVDAVSPGGSPITYEWSASVSGTFTDPTSPSTTFTPDPVDMYTPGIVKCVITDECGRAAIASKPVSFIPAPEPPVAQDDNFALQPNTSITFDPKADNGNGPDTDANLNIDPNSVTFPDYGGGTTANTGNGEFVVNPDGTITYTPNPDWEGTEQITYEICDHLPNTGCDQAVITIVVSNIDENGCNGTEYLMSGYADAVVAENSMTNSIEALGEPLLVAGANNFYARIDGDGDYLVVDLTDVIPAGSEIKLYLGTDDDNDAILAAQGTLNGSDYTNGTDFFNNAGVSGAFTNFSISGANYKLNNVDPVSQLEVTIVFSKDVRYLRFTRSAGGNKPCINGVAYDFCASAIPIAVDDDVTTCEDNPVSIQVTFNDTDPQGLPLSVSLVTSPTNGVAEVNADGTITYTPDRDFSGADAFTYEVCNNFKDGVCAQATVNITITPDECADGFGQFGVGNSYTYLDQFNDKNVANGSDGTADWSGYNWIEQDKDGQIFDPANFTADDVRGDGNLLIPVSDKLNMAWRQVNLLGAADATLTFTYNNSNFNSSDDILIVEASADNGGSYVILDTYTGDLTTDAGAASFNLKQALGVLTETTFIRFRAVSGDKDFIADDVQVEYTEGGCFGECEPLPNNPPVGFFDEISIACDGTETLNVLNNDSDPDGDIIRLVEIVEQPPVGTAVANPDGTITYTRNGAVVEETFTYSIGDNVAGNEMFDTVRVYVYIDNCPPIAEDDAISTNANTPIDIPVLEDNGNGPDTDPEGDDLSVSSIDGYPSNGSVTINGDGTITYIPDEGFTGTDSFTYIVCDPSGLCDEASVTVTVVNQPPVANDDTYDNVSECTPFIATVLDNDTDPEGGNLTITEIVTPPANGIVEILFGKEIYYHTNDEGVTSDQFTYRICDDGDPTQCDEATVNITIAPPPVNQPPVAMDDLYDDGVINEPAIIAVLADNGNGEDYDPEGTTLVVSVPAPNITPAGAGTVVAVGKTVKFIPSEGFVGTVTFEYQICDSPERVALCDTLAPQCDLGLVTVNYYNLPPIANPDEEFTGKNIPVDIYPLENDQDPDGHDINLISADFETAQGGVVAVNNNGTPGDQTDDYLTYTPPLDYSGTDKFTYQICDVVPTEYVLCDIGTVYITIYNSDPGQIAANQTVCEGDPVAELVSLSAASTEDGTIAYQWEKSINGTSFTSIAGATGLNYTPIPVSVDTWFRRKASITATSGAVTHIYSNEVKITINNISGGTVGN